MTTSKLSLFNGALRELGERKLASLTENTETRRALDDVYDHSFKYCLEQGHWKFAQRAAKLDYDADFTSPFGYTYRFAKPSDLVKVSWVCEDEYFSSPLTAYSDESGYWYADLDEIYISYVSNDADFGADMSRWPETYVLFFERYMAFRIAKRITQNKGDVDDLRKLAGDAGKDARSKDAIQGPTRFLPEGGWVSSRRSGRGGGGRQDRGRRGSLTG